MQWGNTSLFRKATGWFMLNVAVIHFQLYEGKKNPQIPFNSTFFNSEGYFAQISPTDTTQMKERSSLYYLQGAVNQMGTSMGVGIKEEEEEGGFICLRGFHIKTLRITGGFSAPQPKPWISCFWNMKDFSYGRIAAGLTFCSLVHMHAAMTDETLLIKEEMSMN